MTSCVSLKKSTLNRLENFKSIIFCPDCLSVSLKEIQEAFVISVLQEMARQVGGMGYFWIKEEKDFVFRGWVYALQDCKPSSIALTLESVLDGKYRDGKSNEVVPRHAVSFKKFLREGSHNRIPDIMPASKQLGYDGPRCEKAEIYLNPLKEWAKSKGRLKLRDVLKKHLEEDFVRELNNFTNKAIRYRWGDIDEEI